MIINREMGRLLKEVVLAYFKVIFQNLPGENLEDHKTLPQDSRLANTQSVCVRKGKM
jgi:hypothetical protein